MASETRISWTDRTFNAWLGCTKVSDGCKFCYAETFTKNRMGLKLWGPRARRQVTKGPWKDVLRWQREAEAGAVGADGVAGRLLVFTGSMMDWAEDRPDLVEPRARMWRLIRQCPNLHFQMLTKRPENIARMLPVDWGDGWPNVWMGTSIEDARVIDRARHLLSVPAAVHFVSYEPAIGPISDELAPYLDAPFIWRCPECKRGTDEAAWKGLCGVGSDPLCPFCEDEVLVDVAGDYSGISWVIYGGESGPGWRSEGTPEDPKRWARDMHSECLYAGVPYFHKQSAAPRNETGVELDGEIIHQFPTPRVLPSQVAEQADLFG